MYTIDQRKALCRSSLFLGLEEKEICALLESGGMYPRRLEKGAVIIEQGGRQKDICVVLSGAAKGEKVTAGGGIVTINTFLPGDVFGDILSGASEESPVTIRMSDEGEIIFVPFSALLRGTDSLFEVRERVLRNLICEIAKKYLALLSRVNMLTTPTLRGKIAYYLINESSHSAESFLVSHNREEQACLLDCDRSAPSRELSRMKVEGIINFSGKIFEILDMRELKKLAQ